jgi:holo-[acyl-carrier protein] synthase
MPSIRTGVDLIDIERFADVYEKYRQRFLEHIFTPTELEENGEKMVSLAVRFAAKEAVSKALGTGIGHVSWHEIEICRGKAGEPILHLYGAAYKLAYEQHLHSWSLSLSHTAKQAVAMVVTLGE